MAKKPIEVKTLTHEGARRRNIPTAEYESVMAASEKSPIQLATSDATAISIHSWFGMARTSRISRT
jgi:hypothetical protein